MKISRESAQTIIDEIGGIVKRQLNFMDDEGVIIAGSDKARIGQLHEGAQRMLREGLDELEVERGQRYTGSREGCNFSLVIDGDVVGVIGITGAPDDVRSYGQIVRRMTEILLRENRQAERQSRDAQIHQRFIDDWLLTGTDVGDERFRGRAAALGIDLDVRRRVVLFGARTAGALADEAEWQRTMEAVGRMVEEGMRCLGGAICASAGSAVVCLIPGEGGAAIGPLAEGVIRRARAEWGVQLVAGVSGAGTMDMRQAYREAGLALKSAGSEQGAVAFYDALTYALFLDEISGRSKRLFVRQLLGDMGEEEAREALALVETLYRQNGSIEKTAAIHHVHKNTLQYRLRTLAEKTGHDPRRHDGIALYTMAILFERERKEGV